MQELVSFIIPSFNRANVLHSSIQSVINQIEKNWELIVVDDGSTDNTREVVQSYLKDKRLRYVYQENKGVSAARNLGASLAEGEFLIFLDSDDIVLRELLTNLDNEKSNRYDLICWQTIKVINGKEKIWKPTRLDSMYNKITASFLAGSACYRRNLFFEVGGYDNNLSFGENYELGLRISQVKKLKIKIINKPLSKYRLPSSRTSNSISNRLNSCFYLYKKHRQLYEENPKSHSEINYLIGYILEKKGEFNKAKKYYRNASKIYNLNFKAHLKRLYFNFLK